VAEQSRLTDARDEDGEDMCLECGDNEVFMDDLCFKCFKTK
jgi:hypothetical protein